MDDNNFLSRIKWYIKSFNMGSFDMVFLAMEVLIHLDASLCAKEFQA